MISQDQPPGNDLRINAADLTMLYDPLPPWLTPEWLYAIFYGAVAQERREGFDDALATGKAHSLIRDAAMAQANTTKPRGRRYAQCLKQIYAFADAVLNEIFHGPPTANAVEGAIAVAGLAARHGLIKAKKEMN